MPPIPQTHSFYGYQINQNPHDQRMRFFVGAINAKVLQDIVSVDNAVEWDNSSNSWKIGGRNRAISNEHWRSILEFLESDNNERILPSSIVISVKPEALNFQPFHSDPIDEVQPGILTITGLYNFNESTGKYEPVNERNRYAWVLDGQHRIKAFREWSSPEPYPINVVIFKAWAGDDYEDSMRHQTYELNMGRPLPNDFKAAIREQYNSQIGHRQYRKEIALSWIRKDLERRSGESGVFSPHGIVGATNYRTPFILTMTTCEHIIEVAYNSSSHLSSTYLTLDSITRNDVAGIGQFLYDFYEGVKCSIGLIHPLHKLHFTDNIALINEYDNYWDIVKNFLKFRRKQKLIHNVGLKAITRALIEPVMSQGRIPENPQEVADKLQHLKGIPWASRSFYPMKDDWVPVLEEALLDRYNAERHNRQYTLELAKRDEHGNPLGNPITIDCQEF